MVGLKQIECHTDQLGQKNLNIGDLT